jgi:hypothetical protein
MRRWVQVVVVVLIVVLVVGLGVAAVPRIRQAASRTSCVNNLKQIGIGLTSYYDTYSHYPGATIQVEDRPSGEDGIPRAVLHPDRRLSWFVEILPFVDQNGIVFDRTRAWDDETNLVPLHRSRELDGTLVEGRAPLGEWKVFLCPANPSVAPHSPGLAHYVGVAGLGAEAAGGRPDDPGIGMFGHDRCTRGEDIKDGAGSTMMVIETTFRNGPWTAGGHPTVRGLDPNGGPYLGAGNQFGNYHASGDLFALTSSTVTNVVFVDGSVHSLRGSIRPQVFEALATIAGGEQVEPGADW